MKLDAGRIAAFLRSPGAIRIVLLHGDDEGMVRHRADMLTQAIIGERDDPFRVAWLQRDDHTRLMEEASAIAMMGGRRVVRVRDGNDALTASVQQVAAAAGDSLVIIETSALPGRSKLRALVEGLPGGASIACYPEEGKALEAAVESGLAAAGVRLDADAMRWLVDHLGSDRGSTRGEIEKLVLYAGADRGLDLGAVQACVGDLAAVSFDDALFAATAGDVAAMDVALDRALIGGLAPVAITRGVLAHLGKLHVARGHMAAGSSVAEAVRALRPPVFFKRVASMTQAVALWSVPRLMTAMREASRVELACKQTGAQDEVLVRRLMLGIARQAGAARVRS